MDKGPVYVAICCECRELLGIYKYLEFAHEDANQHLIDTHPHGNKEVLLIGKKVDDA